MCAASLGSWPASGGAEGAAGVLVVVKSSMNSRSPLDRPRVCRESCALPSSGVCAWLRLRGHGKISWRGELGCCCCSRYRVSPVCLCSEAGWQGPCPAAFQAPAGAPRMYWRLTPQCERSGRRQGELEISSWSCLVRDCCMSDPVPAYSGT